MPQDIGRVFLNLFTYAFYAVLEKKNASAYRQAVSKPIMAEQQDIYEPKVLITTQNLTSKIEIGIQDNGTGIPQKILERIYQRFLPQSTQGRERD